MKSIITGALLSLSLMGGLFAQEFSEKATFIGYDTDFQTFTFEAEDGDYIEFNKVNANVMSKYKLMEKTQRGKDFLIGYDVDAVEDEDGEIVEIYILSKMSPTVIIKEDEVEEDEDF